MQVENVKHDIYSPIILVEIDGIIIRISPCYISSWNAIEWTIDYDETTSLY